MACLARMHALAWMMSTIGARSHFQVTRPSLPIRTRRWGEAGGGAEVYRMNSFLCPSIMGVRYTIVNRLFYSLAVYGQDKFQKRVKVSTLRQGIRTPLYLNLHSMFEHLSTLVSLSHYRSQQSVQAAQVSFDLMVHHNAICYARVACVLGMSGIRLWYFSAEYFYFLIILSSQVSHSFDLDLMVHRAIC